VKWCKRKLELEPDAVEIGAGSLALLMEETPEEFLAWLSEHFRKTSMRDRAE
jgi:hypothetical protein